MIVVITIVLMRGLQRCLFRLGQACEASIRETSNDCSHAFYFYVLMNLLNHKIINMKTNLFRFFATLMYIFAAQTSNAHDFKAVNSDGVTIYYNITSSTELTCEVTSSFYSGAVHIPSTVTYNGNTFEVTSIGNNAFYDCRHLTSINIPNSVTSIGNNAFYDCNLTSRNIPNSVTSIGEYAFTGCSALTSINIPNSVTSIGNNAFERCSGLISLTIPESVTSIGDYAFYNCSQLNEITCLNPIPPIIAEKTFNYRDRCVLKVHKDSYLYYMNAKYCKDFFVIIGIDITGIDSATIDADTNNAPAYNLQGARVNIDYRGIVVKNGKKILKK